MDEEFPVDEAVACYCAGWSVDEIARLFKMDADTTREEIEKARKAGSLVPKRQIERERGCEKSLPAFLESEINGTAHGNELHLIVVPSPHAMFTEYTFNDTAELGEFNKYRKSEKQALLLAASYAANYLREVLLDGREHIVGLNWGSAVRAVIEAITPLPPRSHSRIEVVSLFGDLAFGFHSKKDSSWDPTNTNCNRLVTEFANRIGKPVEEIYLAVPGFIPTTFGDDDKVLKGIKEFLCGHSSYQRIFGNGDKDAGVIGRVDTILTGFGSADDFTLSQGRIGSWLGDEDKGVLNNCQNSLAGDLGGHYEIALESGAVSTECRKFANKLSDRVLAAQPAHFYAVADRHRQYGFGVGVLGVAAGARKAPILKTLLSKDSVPINRLFIDSHCALSLLNRLKGGDKSWQKKLEKQLPEFWGSKEGWSKDTREVLGLI